jgi:hypothetical protein
VVLDEPERVRDLMFELATTGALQSINYFLGGKINDVDVDSMALHPAHRRAIWSVFTYGDDARDRLASFIPNNVTGVCFNHHSPSEPDWRNACWGPHYARLEELKNKYDPNRVFNCWHCPGYVGEEIRRRMLPSRIRTLVSVRVRPRRHRPRRGRYLLL